MSKAQGTIEYIVIIAVVVVISLVVVALLVNQVGQGEKVSSITQQIGNSAQLIGVSEAVVGQDSNALFSLRNNTGESITVTRISVDGIDHNFGKQLVGVDLGSFVLTNLVPCTSSSQVHDVAVTYTTVNGLEKTQSFSKVKIDCVPTVNPKQNFVAETITAFQSRFAYFILDANFSNGIFNYTKLGTIKQNGELDYNTRANYTYQSSDYNRDMNGLVAYYKFNSKNGTVVDDSAGHDNNGTLTNGSDNNALGLWDTNAGFFDGVDDYLSIPASPQWEFGANNFTIAFWFNSFGHQTGATAIARDATTTYVPFSLCWDNGIVGQCNIYMSSNGSTWDIANARTFGAIVYNQWNHYVITRNGTTFTAYKNGKVADSWTSALGLASNSNPLSIGRVQSTYYTKGSIDEVKIYNRSLSAMEIQTDYNKWFVDANYVSPVIDLGSAATDYNFIKFNSNNGVDLNGHIYGTQIEPTIEKDLNTGLVGLWHLNETGGTTFTDSSSSGNSGSCTNCPVPATGLWDTNAQSFDGVNDYILKNSPTNLPTGSTNRTICAWVYPQAQSGENIGIVDYGANSVGQVCRLSRDGTNKQFNINFWGGDASGVIIANDNEWHFVCGVVNSGTNLIYVDGIFDSSTVSSPNTVVGTLKIGNGSDGSFFKGVIEEAAIWNRALSANEVKELFNKGAAKLGVKYNACTDSSMSVGCTGWLPAATDGNTSAGTQINLDSLDGKRYLQYLVKPQLYRFPDGNYFPQAFATLRDVNLIYTN